MRGISNTYTPLASRAFLSLPFLPASRVTTTWYVAKDSDAVDGWVVEDAAYQDHEVEMDIKEG